jgi:hypothetical protein
MKKKKSNRYQKGGNVYNYDKTGNTNITSQEANMLSRNADGMGLQFEPDFTESYFSTNTPPAQVTPVIDYSTQPITDITSDGLFTDRKVWRGQRPEWFVGKREPVEGKDYTIVPHRQWKEYQNSPEYSLFRKKASALAALQYGGDYYQNNNSIDEDTDSQIPYPYLSWRKSLNGKKRRFI